MKGRARTVASLLCALLLGACSGDPAGGDDAPDDATVGDGGAGATTGGAGGGGNQGGTSGGAAGGAADGGTGTATGAAPDDAIPPDPLPPGARAGAYVGRLDDGEGVLVLRRDGRLVGLTERADGSAVSWVADFGAGTESEAAERFVHAAGRDAARGTFAPLSRADGRGPELGLVDGERIGAVGPGATVALEASGRADLAPLGVAALAGRWSGEHTSCDSLGERCARTRVTLDVDGTAMTGSSGVFVADGVDVYPVPISGRFAPLGDFAEVDFVWNTYGYAGALHFLPGESDRFVLVGATDRELADHRVFAVVLERDRSP